MDASLAFFLLSQNNIREILLFIQTPGYLLQIGNCLFWGGRVGLGKWKYDLPDLSGPPASSSTCLWDLLVFQEILAGRALSSVIELGVRGPGV